MGASISTNCEKQTSFSKLPILSGTEDRAVGCLVGLAVGDAFGVTQERFPYGTLEQTIAMVQQQRQDMQQKGLQVDIQGGGPWVPMFVLKPGEWTDDTAQALCLADSLLSCGKLDQQDLMDKFVAWWEEGYNACRYEKGKDGVLHGLSLGLGKTVKAALRKFQDSGRQEVKVQDLDPERHAGNGCIMRLAPVAIYWHDKCKEAIYAARRQSETTHNLPECLDASALLAQLLVRAIQGSKRDDLLDPFILQNASSPFAFAAGHNSSPPPSPPTSSSTGSSFFCPDLPDLGLTHDGILELTRVDARWRKKSEEDILTLPGRALWTLEAALWVVNRTSSFREAMILAASLGGDADTVGAVVGQIAGALYGESAIPTKWRAALHHYPKIRERALRLARREPFSAELQLP